MKKTLAILAVCAVAVGAFGQGKVIFGNGATRAVTTDSRAAYSKNLGTSLAVPQTELGILTGQLWGGTSAGSLTLQATFTGVGQAGFDPGVMLNSTVLLTGIPAGAAFFRIDLWETAAGSYANASNPLNAGWWYGQTAVFGATAGSFAPTPLSSSALWPAGPITLSANPPVPEPSTFVLAGLGVASLLLFRRRK